MGKDLPTLGHGARVTRRTAYTLIEVDDAIRPGR